MKSLDIDKYVSVKAGDLEGLPWYDVVSRLGLQSFNTMGNKPVETIARLAGISKGSTVVMAGCGSGGTAVHLAEITGAEVHGIDISAESIEAAKRLASKSTAAARLHFRTGNAHELPFPPGSCDFIITEYMAFFLSQKAFDGFHKALKPGGCVALAELVKDPRVTAGADGKILAAEKTYSGLIGYDFHIPLVTDHIRHLENAGFGSVGIAERFPRPQFKDQLEAVGGWKNLRRIMGATVSLMFKSRELRKKMLQMGAVKGVISRNASTARFIFQAVIMGRKA